MTSTSFGLVIAYLLPGLIAFYGASQWSDAVANVFSTFLTADSNVALFLMVFVAGLALGLVLQAFAWAIFDEIIFRHLFSKDRILLRVSLMGGVLFAGFKVQKLEQITSADYNRLFEGGRLPAYRAYIDEVYRYYQFWSGTLLALPLVLLGWASKSSASWGVIGTIAFAIAAFAAEAVVFLKCADGWIGTHGTGLSILRGVPDVSSEEAIDGEAQDSGSQARG